MPGERKPGTIVLVHGTWTDGSVWKEVLMPLAHEGYRVRAAQLPLTGFAADVAAVELLLDHVEAPVLLVGHSYGGAVISAAGNHEKVKALGYVCGFAPEADEVFGSLLAMHRAAEQMTLQPDAHGFLWLDADFGVRALGHDLHRGYLNFAVTVQKPVHHAVFEATLRTPAWKSRPSAYLVTTEDRILAPETQQALAQRIGARVETVAASHMVILSQAEAVSGFLRRSAAGLGG